jgi:hypothetical protein
MKEFTMMEKDAIMAEVAANLSGEVCVASLVDYYEKFHAMWKLETPEEFEDRMRTYGFMVMAEEEFRAREIDAGDFFHNDEIMSRFNKMLDAAFAEVYPKFLAKIAK